MLDAVRKYLGIGEVSSIVEMEDTFLPESFKGYIYKWLQFASNEKDIVKAIHFLIN